MSTSLTERLLHSLEYSSSIVIYKDKDVALQQQLFIFDNGVDIGFIISSADDGLIELKSKIVQQLFNNASFDPELTLNQLFTQFKSKARSYVLIFNDLLCIELLSELIELQQAHYGNVRIVIELPKLRQQALILQLKKLGAEVSLVSNEYSISEPKSDASDFSSLLNQQKKMPAWFFFLSIFIVIILISALLYTFTTSQGESLKALTNDELALPLKNDTSLQVTAVIENTVKSNNLSSITEQTAVTETLESLEVKLVDEKAEAEKNKSTKLMPEDLSANKVEANTAEVISTEAAVTQAWPNVKRFVELEAKRLKAIAYFPLAIKSDATELSADTVITSNELIKNASKNVLTKVNLGMLSHPMISSALLLKKLKLVFLTRDEINAWLNQADGSRYVLQISLIASKESLINYLQNYGQYQDLKFYYSKNGFALVFGDYENAGRARMAIDKLPKAFQTKDIWARSVSSIQRLIKQEETIE